MDDLAKLVEQAQAGSQAAFEDLVRRFHTPIRAYLARLIGDEEQARDLTQEVFTQAWKKLADLREPAHLRAWLFRVATNRAHSWLRRRRIVHWVSLDRWREPQVPDTPTGERPIEPAALQAPESGFEERLAQAEALGRALRAVPLAYRICLLLYLSHGFAVDEIAAQLDISQVAVRTRLSRGLAMLREAYAREDA